MARKSHFFDNSKYLTPDKLRNFSKYVRRQDIARFMGLYELFKKQIDCKGSIVECGVHQGGGLLTWAKLSSILEPYNHHRKIIGFDTFRGIPKKSTFDKTKKNNKINFKENINIIKELKDCIKEYNLNRFINNKKKIELIKGDAIKTIPKFIKNNKHILISLLYFDFVVYEPTKVALEYFLPRMSKGSIIAFNELNNEDWPGETVAFLNKSKLKHYKLECFKFDSNIFNIVLK